MSAFVPDPDFHAKTEKLPRDSWLEWPEVKTLIGAFEAQDAPIRFVGGAVRDALLNRPVSDIDAATPLPPQKVMSMLEAAGIRAIPTGLSHGTVTAVVDGRSFEITTLRRDVKTNGRHAEVLFTDSWEEDARRRDFTMNALFCDSAGKIYDYTNGLEDAQHGIVRFIGDAGKRVQEDALRILRFFRFSAHYSKSDLDKEGLQASKKYWTLIAGLSGERIREEMMKLLRADRAPRMLEVMERTDLTESIFGDEMEVEAIKFWPNVRLMADVAPDEVVALALLIRAKSDSGSQVSKLANHWKLSNKQVETLLRLSVAHTIDADADEAQQKKLLRQIGPDNYRKLVLISWVEHLAHYQENTQLLAAAYRAMLALPDHWNAPEFPLTGEDIMGAGIPSGPKVGEYLATLKDYWEADHYKPTKEALLQHLQDQLELDS